MSRLAELYASLEDKSSTNTEEMIKENKRNADEAIAALNEDGKEIENIDENTKKMKDSAKGVDDIAEEMRTLIEHGKGLSVESAAFAHHAINAHLRYIGLTADEIMPGLESFSDPDNREYYSQIALEAAEKTSSKIWANIKKYAEIAFEKIKAFFLKLRNMFPFLRKKTEDLKEAVKAEPKKEEPKEEPKKTEPKKEEPKTEEPKEEPKKEEPKTEEPVKEAIKKEEPKKDNDEDDDFGIFNRREHNDLLRGLAFEDSVSFDKIVKGLNKSISVAKNDYTTYLKLTKETMEIGVKAGKIYDDKNIEDSKAREKEYMDSSIRAINDKYSSILSVGENEISGKVKIVVNKRNFAINLISDTMDSKSYGNFEILSTKQSLTLLEKSTELIKQIEIMTKLVDDKSEFWKAAAEVVQWNGGAPSFSINKNLRKFTGGSRLITQYTDIIKQYVKINNSITIYVAKCKDQ